MSPTRSVLAAALAALACAAGAEAWRPERRHTHVQREAVEDASRGVRRELPEAQWYEQTLDHFDAQDNSTYQQRYWVNDTFYRSALDAGVASPPVFLYIEGEGAGSAYDAVAGHHVEMAAQHGALVLVVEHRYFGASVPTETLSTENLRWLSSDQALADLSEFHSFAEDRWALSRNNTWIAFGGSYPGSLSAWIRLKYPHQIYASVASSAPVEAKVNFEAYNEVVASALAMELVGGSAECLENVNTAFKTVNTLLARGSDGGFAKLEALFNPCSPLADASGDDIGVFVGALSGAFQGTVQYNDEIPGRPSVRTMCAQMTNGSLPVADLAALVAQQSGGGCIDISYDDELDMLLNTTVDRGVTGVGDRQWLYMTCTQFGYYQTCDSNTTCPWHTNTQTLGSNLDLCKTLFDIDPQAVDDRVAFTNDYYGATDLQGSRILMVDGTVDPWHALSVLAPVPGTTVDSLFIHGTAHCANMMSSRPDDPEYLKAARRVIEGQVTEWLENRQF